MIKNFLYNYFVSRKISFKLMILTLLFSAVITFFITVVQLYIDYKNGIESIDTQFSLVQSGYSASITQSVWVYDKKQTLLQLEGILNLPDIDYASITFLDDEVLEDGKRIEKNFLTKKMPLTYLHNNKEIKLGELLIEADLNKLYNQLIDKIILILTSQAIKTFITSFFILFIFQRLVTRHLEEIAEFTKNLTIDTKPQKLHLDKLSSISTRDELDNLTEAINTMQEQIYKSYLSVKLELEARKRAEKSLAKHYQTDTLTNLGNRFKLFNDIEKITHPAIAILDIDSFKEINDFYGHKIGDFVIVELSRRLLNYFSGEPIYEVYRLQGDQFGLLFRDYSSQDIFEEIVDTLIKDLTIEPIFFEQHEILIRITAGISVDTKNIFINADIALKLAKESKRNFITYSKDFNVTKEYKNNLDWSKKIKKALEEKRIVAFFQPLYNHQTKRIEKFEALVRMIDINGEIISPFFFLEISKKAKLYSKITMIMIDATIEAAKKQEYEFSINFTLEDIRNQDVVSYFLKRIEDSNIGHKIVIEVVESEEIENFEEFHSFVKNIKKFGCKLAIDDFGTGYSNFQYLLKLDVDYLKIDGSLINEIDKNRDMRLVAETIVAFSKTAKIKTIAEFVYSKEIEDIVQEIGVDYSQGYYIGKPISYDEILK